MRLYTAEKNMLLDTSLAAQANDFIATARILAGRPPLYIELFRYIPKDCFAAGLTADKLSFLVKNDLIDPSERYRYIRSICKMNEIIEDTIDYFYSNCSIGYITECYWSP